MDSTCFVRPSDTDLRCLTCFASQNNSMQRNCLNEVLAWSSCYIFFFPKLVYEPFAFSSVTSSQNVLSEDHHLLLVSLLYTWCLAHLQVYEGAIYMNQGHTFLVKRLDLSSKIAWCQKADLNYYTKTRDFTDIHIIGSQFVCSTFFLLFVLWIFRVKWWLSTYDFVPLSYMELWREDFYHILKNGFDSWLFRDPETIKKKRI